jgi:hypothetical protein
MIEIAAATAPAVLDLARSAKGLSNPRILPDHEGHARFLIADHG